MIILDPMNQFKYKAYGLTLQSNQPLKGLIPTCSNAPFDVLVDLIGEWDLKSLPQATLNFTPYQNQDDEFGMRVWSEQREDSSYTRLWFRGTINPSATVDFSIDQGGERISVIWNQMEIDDVITILLGSVLGCLLRLRGATPLHGCVVAIGEKSIVILGDKGAGKSTTAAALASRGHSILSDDIAVLSDSPKVSSSAYRTQYWLVQPGYPRLRLWPKSINALYKGSEANLTPVFISWEKHFVELNDNSNETGWQFHREPLPLAAIYVLGERQPGYSPPAIEPIPPMTAVMTLMTHRSVSHFQLASDRLAQEFADLSRVGMKVPVRKVIRSDSLEALPQLCEAIVEDTRRH